MHVENNKLHEYSALTCQLCFPIVAKLGDSIERSILILDEISCCSGTLYFACNIRMYPEEISDLI